MPSRSKRKMGGHYFSGELGCIVTFRFGPHELRTLVAMSRADAYEQARARWGDGWYGEPCVSTPASILRDVTGETRLAHGQDLDRTLGSASDERKRRLHREGH